MNRTVLFSVILILTATGTLSAQKPEKIIDNTCLDLYNSGKKEEARDCYLQYDSLPIALYNAALCSRGLNDIQAYTMQSEKLISKDYRTAISYDLYARLHWENQKKYFKIINRGLRIFGNDTILLISKSNYFLRQNDFKNVVKTVDKIIPIKKRGLANLYFTRGTAYQNLKDTAQAIKDFKMAISVDSDYFDAIFNLASVYYNAGVDLFEQAQKIPFQEIDKYKKVVDLMLIEFTKALPWLEKAYSLQPGNEYIVRSLKSVYSQLKMSEKYQELKKQSP